jgi:hypothetical protein
MLATLELLNQSIVNLAKIFGAVEVPSKILPRKKLKFQALHNEIYLKKWEDMFSWVKDCYFKYRNKRSEVNFLSEAAETQVDVCSG